MYPILTVFLRRSTVLTTGPSLSISVLRYGGLQARTSMFRIGIPLVRGKNVPDFPLPDVGEA